MIDCISYRRDCIFKLFFNRTDKLPYRKCHKRPEKVLRITIFYWPVIPYLLSTICVKASDICTARVRSFVSVFLFRVVRVLVQHERDQVPRAGQAGVHDADRQGQRRRHELAQDALQVRREKKKINIKIVGKKSNWVVKRGRKKS